MRLYRSQAWGLYPPHAGTVVRSAKGEAESGSWCPGWSNATRHRGKCFRGMKKWLGEFGEDSRVEVEELTFWERVSFWVWGFLDILMFRHKAVLSSSAYEVWTQVWSPGVGMAKRHRCRSWSHKTLTQLEKQGRTTVLGSKCKRLFFFFTVFDKWEPVVRGCRTGVTSASQEGKMASPVCIL